MDLKRCSLDDVSKWNERANREKAKAIDYIFDENQAKIKVAWISMKFSGIVYWSITNHSCEFQFANPKDSTKNKVQIDWSLGV